MPTTQNRKSRGAVLVKPIEPPRVPLEIWGLAVNIPTLSEAKQGEVESNQNAYVD